MLECIVLVLPCDDLTLSLGDHAYGSYTVILRENV